ncbi:hypothetical protein ACOI9X_10845 [Pseudomonas sp. P2757]|uniref:hypothetical protein n=1 Tax=unclassified Pseudomonas TaxID=196821 RepID=UPI003B58F099
MTRMNSLKGAALTALLAISFAAVEASASDNAARPSQCDGNFAYNPLVETAVTPQLLEELREMSGAATVRHEKTGEIYTQEYRSDRLRVFSAKGNVYSHVQCG